ncbi:hypothetical protein POM88_010136 [Heracleum sosnowskyi]|uniref:PCI domain-containing protein n=1 Tax=Heracleum sosnowskyi TaxID=360622 RepID=A0AAD8JBX5_9APIA|nr:hypothetical protein POM88_010136 [Heracleum sosnowskyi]
MQDIYNHAHGVPPYSCNPMSGPPSLVMGSPDANNISAAEVYRQKHEITATALPVLRSVPMGSSDNASYDTCNTALTMLRGDSDLCEKDRVQYLTAIGRQRPLYFLIKYPETIKNGELQALEDAKSSAIQAILENVRLQVFFENVDKVDENKKGVSDQEKVSFDHDITFAEIKEALKISADEVTSWINKVVKYGLIKCRIDEDKQKIVVSRVYDQGKGRQCWALATSACLHGLCYLEHEERRFRPSTQELIDEVIKAYPKIAKHPDFEIETKTKTYGTKYTDSFKFMMEYGTTLEANYPDQKVRDEHKSWPPSKGEVCLPLEGDHDLCSSCTF